MTPFQLLNPVYALLFATPQSAFDRSTAMIRPVMIMHPDGHMTRGTVNTPDAWRRSPRSLRPSLGLLESSLFHGAGIDPDSTFREIDRDLERMFELIDRVSRVDGEPMRQDEHSAAATPAEGKEPAQSNKEVAEDSSSSAPSSSAPPSSWRSSFSYSRSSSDGRSVTKRTYRDSSGRQTEKELRSLLDGDRVVSRKTHSHHGGASAPGAIESASPSEEEEGGGGGGGAMARAGQEVRVTIEGAKDEAEFEALWNKRTKLIEERRARAVQQQEQWLKQLRLRRAEIEAKEITQQAESLKQQAAQAEEAAAQARAAYEALIHGDQENDQTPKADHAAVAADHKYGDGDPAGEEERLQREEQEEGEELIDLDA